MQAQTTLKSVSYQIGRTGAVTPVANLDPVLLGGTIVKRASLHNQDQINKLNLHLNDRVIIEKGGEIILNKISRNENNEFDIFPSKNSLKVFLMPSGRIQSSIVLGRYFSTQRNSSRIINPQILHNLLCPHQGEEVYQPLHYG